MEGVGVQVIANPYTVREGEFKEGQFHGKMVVMFGDTRTGQVYNQIWNKGKNIFWANSCIKERMQDAFYIDGKP